MEDRFKKIEKLIDEIFDEKSSSDDNIKGTIKNQVKEIANNFSGECVIFLTEKDCFRAGKLIEIEALTYSYLKSLLEKEDLNVKELTKLFIRAIATKDDIKTVDKDVLNEVLETIKDMF